MLRDFFYGNNILHIPLYTKFDRSVYIFCPSQWLRRLEQHQQIIGLQMVF